MMVLTKLKAYAIAFLSFVVAILGTYLWARHKGNEEGEGDQKAADAKVTADAIKTQLDTRAEVDLEVSDLPKPKITITTPSSLPVSDGSQQVGTAEVGTAASDLKSHWMRDG